MFWRKKKKEIPTNLMGGVAPVIVINDGKLIYDILGITEDRATAIHVELERLIILKKDTVSVMVEFSKFCLHQNEFSFGIFILHDVIEKTATREAFKEIFGNLKK